MRPLCLALLLGPGLAAAQARLVVEVGGKRAGYATISQKRMPDGSKTVELRLQIGKMRLTTQSTFASDGSPTRKFHEVLEPELDKKRVLVEFDAAGAIVTDLGGDRSPRKVPLVSTGNRKNLAEFWFLRDQPKRGDRVEAFVFDLNTWTWDLSVTEFLGPATVEVAGKPRKGFELRVEQGGKASRVVVDEAGLPLLIDQGRVVMKRFA